MPELPEVETIKRQLSRKIKGKKIKTVEVFLPRFVKYPQQKFKKLVAGAKIKKINRRAKLLIIELSNDYCLVIHLKLTGQLIFNGSLNKHTHLIYHFTDGSCLLHNDLRRFGFVKVIAKKDLADFLKKEKFGPEPLSKEFTLELFKKLLSQRKNSKIKPLLMDQKFMAGIGNLYADEILFYAGVLPFRKVGALKAREIKKIYQEIKRVLELAIRKQGSSVEYYLDTSGKKGNFVPLIQVYQRTGQPCYRCKTKIKRLKINGRSAHFCPKCQK